MKKLLLPIYFVLLFLIPQQSYSISTIDIPYVSKKQNTFATDVGVICHITINVAAIHPPVKQGDDSVSGADLTSMCDKLRKIQIDDGLNNQTSLKLWENVLLRKAVLDESKDLLRRFKEQAKKAHKDKLAENEIDKYVSGITKAKLNKNEQELKKLEKELKEKEDVEKVVIKVETSTAEDKQISEAPQFQSIESRIINGTYMFLEKRAKQEAMLYFQDELKKRICAEPKKGRLGTKDYFKHSCAAMDSIGVTMTIQSISEHLRNALKKDLENIPNAMLADGAKVAIKEENKELAEVLHGMRVVLVIYDEMRDGRSPEDVIRGMTKIGGLDCKDAVVDEEGKTIVVAECKDLDDIIRKFAHIYKLIEENVDGFEEDESTVIKNARVISTIFGLKGMEGKTGISEAKARENIAEWQKIYNEVKEIAVETKELRKAIKSIDDSKGQSDSKRIEAVELVITKLVDTIAVMKSSDLFKDEDDKKLADINDFVKKAEDVKRVLGVGRALISENESEIIFAVMDVVEWIDGQIEKEEIKIPSEVMAVTGFAVQMASAKTPAEVSNVIEAVASPVGSYRMKQESTMTSLTAFFGAANVKERYSGGLVDDKSRQEVYPFVPIGFHYTKPFNVYMKKNKNDSKMKRFGKSIGNLFAGHGYFGVYASLLDLGPLVAEGEEEDGLSQRDHVTFKQVFSPGLYVTYSRKNTGPFTLGAGVSKTPALWYDDNEEDVDSTRYVLFLAMDLTLFPF